jgi:hypothetical protein
VARPDHERHNEELVRLRARIAEYESNTKDKRSEQFRDIVIAIAFTAGPFGFGVPIFYSCISWTVAWLAFIHLIWNLEHFSHVMGRSKGIAAVTISVVLVAAVYSPIRTAYFREKARATSGDLVASDDGKDHTSDLPTLQIGSSVTTISWNGNSDDPQMQTNYDKIHLQMVKGRIYLSTTIRDENQNLIAEIIDNHWIVSSSTASCWDKNYTKDSLEVKDGRGRVVLQVRVLPNIVQFQAEWLASHGGILQTGKYDKNGIKPMFKYPSELYWGERDPTAY